MPAARLPPSLERLLALPDASRRVGPFLLVEQLGRGGDAPVWLAKEVYGDVCVRMTAVKLFAVDPRSSDRDAIIAEARALCRLEHPHVVRFYAIAEDASHDVLGLAMEYVGGPPLSTRIRDEGQLGVADTIAVGVAVASALAAVHQAGLVHRDVKPANIVDASGVYKLIDFGIARTFTPVSGPPKSRSRTESEPPPASRAVAGTLGYIDPECAFHGKNAEASSDLYALGATLYECLAGKIPAAASANAGEGLSGDVLDGRSPPRSIRALVPEVPEALAKLVDALVAPARTARPRSAEGVARELERIRAGLSGRARRLLPEAVGPFRGLAAFDAEDRDVYFGRAAEVAAALEVLRGRGVLALVGASGSGKSSLARAGVLPAIGDGALGAWPPAWDLVTCVPTTDPRGALLRALAPFVSTAGESAAEDSSPAALVARLLERAQVEARGVVLLVDQLEEAVTVGDGGRAFVAEFLARIGEEPLPGLRAVVTVRRDLFDLVLALGDGRALARGTLLVSPMSDLAWGDVVDQALAAYGYAFEDDALKGELLAELRGDGAAALTAASMPLVQFALTRLWEKRDPEKKLLTRASARAMGGLKGALGRHADATLERVAALSPGARGLAREMLLALTTPEGTRRTRTAEELAKLGGAEPRVLRELEAARLVVAEADHGVTLAHEALLTQWRTLDGWIAEVKRDRVLAEEIERDAARWLSERDAPVWQKTKLAAAEELRERGAARLSENAAHFVAAGRRVERRLRARTRGAMAALAALAVVAGGFAVSAWRDKETAVLASKIAQADQATLEKKTKANDIAYRLWDVEDAEERIAVYKDALVADQEWDDGYFMLAVAYLDRADELDKTDATEAAAMRQRSIDAAKAAISYGVGARGYFQVGQALEELEDHAGARDSLMDAARTARPSEAFVKHASLAAIAFDEHRWPDVIDECTAALNAKKGADMTLYRRAFAELRTGQLDPALADATAAIAVWADDARYWGLRSDVRLARGEPRPAAEDLASGARKNGRAPRLLARLSRWALAAGALDRAAKLAGLAVESGSGVPDVYLARARVRQAAGDDAPALADVRTARSLDPLDEDAIALEQAYAKPSSNMDDLLAAGLFTRALAIADGIIASKTGGDAGAVVVAAEVLLARGDAKGALSRVEAASSSARTKDGRVLALRALARRRLALPDEGDAEKAVALGDVSPRALRERALARLAKKDFEGAAVDAARALAGDALDPEARIVAVRAGLVAKDARRTTDEMADDVALLAAVAPDLAADVLALAKDAGVPAPPSLSPSPASPSPGSAP